MAITAQAGRREWVGLAVLTLPCLLYAMDLTVLNLAVPAISQEPAAERRRAAVDRGHLRLRARRVAGHDGYPGRPDRPAPTAADRRGRVRAASVLAAYATSPGMLIAARALLGLAGATLAPSTLSLIRNMFADPRSADGSPSACGSPASRRAARPGR